MVWISTIECMVHVLKHFPMSKDVKEISASFFAIKDAAIALTPLVIRKCFNTLTIHFGPDPYCTHIQVIFLFLLKQMIKLQKLAN